MVISCALVGVALTLIPAVSTHTTARAQETRGVQDSRVTEGSAQVPPNVFRGAQVSGEGDTHFLSLLDAAARQHTTTDAELQTVGQLYRGDWDGLMEGTGWGAWWYVLRLVAMQSSMHYHFNMISKHTHTHTHHTLSLTHSLTVVSIHSTTTRVACSTASWPLSRALPHRTSPHCIGHPYFICLSNCQRSSTGHKTRTVRHTVRCP